MERKDSESSDNGLLKRKSSLPPGKLRSGVSKARGRIVSCQLPGPRFPGFGGLGSSGEETTTFRNIPSLKKFIF
ncbi:Protein CBG11660 [Caenorhabditis briggsae]|uniref:Protein CBG11660 n=1 Tax=Caenorhabditis briggsae TaxID=6238 RepID=A8XDR2_CAEBR|nr:Protein CBG11660 [Caenorhabditis briggsae]CAP30782.1 Protein CBG11660 [Caenorhabditis briggsae]